MIVDDEPYNLFGFQIILQQCGISNSEKYIDNACNGR